MRRPGQTAFLLLLVVYDLLMMLHVHQTQMGLTEISSAYGPIHPLLPLGGDAEPLLEMKHAWWLVVAHGMGSAVPLVLGAAQIALVVRQRNITLHRWSGRLILFSTVVFAALPGMWMAKDMLYSSAWLATVTAVLGAIVIGASWATWAFARRGDIARHRRWAVRLYTYLHAIPVISRLIFWALWVGWARPDGLSEAEAISRTFELMGWITVAVMVPLGELFARLEAGPRDVPQPVM